MKEALLVIVLAPFAGAFLLALLGRALPRRVVEGIACASVAGSFVGALCAFLAADSESLTVTLCNWFAVGNLSASMSVTWDRLSSVMVLMVTFVSALIHVYSVGYMREDTDYVRYFCYLNLFVSAMLVIALSDNLAFLYLGWEGVGFCSYALIGFWYRDAVRAVAGSKAFVVTRIGDVAFGIAIALLFVSAGTLSISQVNATVAGLDPPTAGLLGLLFLWAAAGKSAQLPLSVWLPDAMAGPTPVSALIHAATMVTAGVYLLMRFFPVIALSPAVLAVIAAAGALTAFYAACSALAQRDIKRILAYSTISQVGYMVLGVGAGDVAGSMFHLLSHAFFKALLFLGAGCVIQALHHEQDIFRMGGLRSRLPKVYWVFLAGALALAAVPPFGSFFSKDRILLAVFSHPDAFHRLLWVIALATSLVTSLYIFRLFFVVFLGRAETAEGGATLPLPPVMVFTLVPLAVISLGSGIINLPALWSGNEWLSRYLEPFTRTALHPASPSPDLERVMEAVGGLLAMAGVLIAWMRYRPPAPLAAPARAPESGAAREFFLAGWLLDRLYTRALVRPYRKLAEFSWLKLDEGTVDAAFDRTGSFVARLSESFRMWTTGRLSYYVKMIFLGFAAILSFLVVRMVLL